MSDTATTANADQRLAIAGGLDVVLLSADEALVQYGTRTHPSELLRDADLTGVLGSTLARLLEGPASAAELIEADPRRARDIQGVIEALLARGYLVPESTDPMQAYLAHAEGDGTALADQTVAVVGCGPLGARIGRALADHGVGSLVVGDDRPIDRDWRRFVPVDLERIGADGESSADAVAGWLRSDGRSVRRLPDPLDEEALEEALRASSLVVLASERLDLRTAHLLNRLAVRRHRPWLHVLIDGNHGIVGPLFRPPHTACYNELQALRRSTTPSATMMHRYRLHLLERGRGSFFTGLPVYADLVAGYATLGLLHFLLRGRCFAIGRAMVIDFEQLSIDVDDVLRLPRCPVCAGEQRPPRAPFRAGSAAAGPAEAVAERGT